MAGFLHHLPFKDKINISEKSFVCFLTPYLEEQRKERWSKRKKEWGGGSEGEGDKEEE